MLGAAVWASRSATIACQRREALVRPGVALPPDHAGSGTRIDESHAGHDPVIPPLNRAFDDEIGRQECGDAGDGISHAISYLHHRSA